MDNSAKPLRCRAEDAGSQPRPGLRTCYGCETSDALGRQHLCRRPPTHPGARHLRPIDQPDPPPTLRQQPRPRLGHLAAPVPVRVPTRRRRPALPPVEPESRTRPVQHHRRLPSLAFPKMLADVQQHVRHRAPHFGRRPLDHVVEARRQHPPAASAHPVHAPRTAPRGSSCRWQASSCRPPRPGSARGCPGSCRCTTRNPGRSAALPSNSRDLRTRRLPAPGRAPPQPAGRNSKVVCLRFWRHFLFTAGVTGEYCLMTERVAQDTVYTTSIQCFFGRPSAQMKRAMFPPWATEPHQGRAPT